MVLGSRRKTVLGKDDSELPAWGCGILSYYSSTGVECLSLGS